MTHKVNIQYYKWDEKEYKELFNSIREIIEMKSCQFYMPFYSLYFNIHNSKKSLQKIDLNRNYYIKEIMDITKSRYYNSNMFLSSKIYNSAKNIIETKEIFCKTSPIVDVMHCINDNYNFVNKNNYHLPSAYNYNTFKKINDMNNTAYIDVFCSFLFGNLSYNKINPSFALYYGSVNGIGDYKYDISDEYHEIKYDKCFNKCVDKGFKLDVYISGSDNESDSESENESGSESEKDSESDNDDYIAMVKDIPLQLLFIEKLEGTLEDLIDDNISEELLLSCIFQVAFALTYLQKHYNFTHNDLHINNIMYTSTETKYLYYKLNNIYYRVPTHGKIFKIIDFGRAIFKFRNKTFMNDVFSKAGEAGGQYSYPSQVDFLHEKEKEIINPNPHFDLCRLSMTILEEINVDNYSDTIIDLMINMCNDSRGNNLCNMRDDFKLYMDIGKYACNSLPREIILHNIFKDYRVKKSVFPRKSYYTL